MSLRVESVISTMKIWCKLLAYAFVVFCFVDGEVEDITKDSYKSSLNGAIVRNKFEDTNARESGHFLGDRIKNYLFDEANKGNTIKQLQLKRSNSPPYNPAQFEYSKKINNPTNGLKPQSRHEENFIQVPNKGGWLEKIKRVHLSSNANGQEGVQYNNNTNQRESYESEHVRHGYESILDPNSGYHIISEKEKDHSDEPNTDDLAFSNKKIVFDHDRSQVENSKNININSELHPIRQVLPNIDTDIDEERKHQSHDTLYLVKPNLEKSEKSGEISGLKDIVSNIDGIWVLVKVNNGFEGTKNNQTMFPRQNKAQEPNSYHRDPHNNFDQKLVNFEIEKNNSSERRYVAGDSNVESINLEGKTEFENQQGGNNESDKLANKDLKYADQKVTIYDFSRKQQHLPKVSNEHKERTLFHNADQLIQKQNLNYGSQQLSFKSFEDAFQQQNEQINVPSKSDQYQIDDKKEEKMHIHNYDKKESNANSSLYKEQMLNYGREQSLERDYPANKELLHPSYFMPIYEAPDMGNKYKDHDQPPFHNSRPIELVQQNDQLPEEPIFKLAKKEHL